MNAFNVRDPEPEDVAAKLLRERRIRWCLTVLTLAATALNFSQVRQTLYLQSVPESGSSRSLGLIPNIDDVHSLPQTLLLIDWPAPPNPAYFTSQSNKTYQKLGPYPGQEEELTLVWRHELLEAGEYTGQWNTRDERHGYGRYVYFNGEIYEGYWRNGTRTGNGRQIYADGSVYFGEFEKDKRVGLGTYHYMDGSIYTGTWAHDEKQGIGFMKSGNESKFGMEQLFGEWFQNKLHGRGAYFQRDGRMYVGHFQRYKKHGQGIIGYPDGRICSGKWEHNELSGTGTCLYPNGDVYREERVNGVKSGNGTLTHPGVVDRGVWTNDVLG